LSSVIPENNLKNVLQSGIKHLTLQSVVQGKRISKTRELSEDVTIVLRQLVPSNVIHTLSEIFETGPNKESIRSLLEIVNVI
jgi:hypothetical protein